MKKFSTVSLCGKQLGRSVSTMPPPMWHTELSYSKMLKFTFWGPRARNRTSKNVNFTLLTVSLRVNLSVKILLIALGLGQNFSIL